MSDNEERVPLTSREAAGILIRTNTKKPSAIVNEHVPLDREGVETVVDAVVAYFEGKPMTPSVMENLQVVILSELIRQGFDLRTIGGAFFEPSEYWVRVQVEKGRKFIVEVRWKIESVDEHSLAGGSFGKLYPEDWE